MPCRVTPGRVTPPARRARDISAACHISRDISEGAVIYQQRFEQGPRRQKGGGGEGKEAGWVWVPSPSLQTDFSDSFPNGSPYWPHPYLGSPVCLSGSLLPLPPPYGSLWVCLSSGSLLGGGPFSLPWVMGRVPTDRANGETPGPVGTVSRMGCNTRENRMTALETRHPCFQYSTPLIGT